MLDEVRIYEHSTLRDQRVGSIRFRDYKLVLIGVWKADAREFVFNPEDDFLLEAGDVLLVMGHRMSIGYFRENSCLENNRCL